MQVFLQHLGPLSSLPTFTALWLTILDFLAQFVSTASSDLLADALPESLKNMLLVMDTSGRNLFFRGQKEFFFNILSSGAVVQAGYGKILILFENFTGQYRYLTSKIICSPTF